MPKTLFIKASPGEGKTITISTENDPNNPLSEKEFSAFNDDLYKIAKIVGPRVKGQGITFGLGMGKDGFKGSLTFKQQDLPTRVKSECIKADIAIRFAGGDHEKDIKPVYPNLQVIAKKHNVNIIFYESLGAPDSTAPQILLHLQVYSNGLYSTLSAVPETPKPDPSATSRLYCLDSPRKPNPVEAKSQPAEASSIPDTLSVILGLCESIEESILQTMPLTIYKDANKLSAIARVKMAVIRCQKHIAPPPPKPITGKSLPSMPVDTLNVDALLDEMKSAFPSPPYASTCEHLIERLSALKQILKTPRLRARQVTTEEKQFPDIPPDLSKATPPPVAYSAPSSPMLPIMSAIRDAARPASAPVTPVSSPRQAAQLVTHATASPALPASSSTSGSSPSSSSPHFFAKKLTANEYPPEIAPSLPTTLSPAPQPAPSSQHSSSSSVPTTWFSYPRW